MTALVPMFVWCRCMVVHMRSLRRKCIFWAVGIVTRWWNTRTLSCTCLITAFNELAAASAAIYTPTWWRSPRLTEWKEQKVVIGWLPILQWGRPSSDATSPCSSLQKLLPILWKCGPWQCQNSKRRVKKMTQTVLWWGPPLSVISK